MKKVVTKVGPGVNSVELLKVCVLLIIYTHTLF